MNPFTCRSPITSVFSLNLLAYFGIDGLTMEISSGALKANVGHLEGGSGVAAVIKTIMILEKGIIPPNANFESVNPRIDADFLNLKVRSNLLLPDHFPVL